MTFSVWNDVDRHRGTDTGRSTVADGAGHSDDEGGVFGGDEDVGRSADHGARVHIGRGVTVNEVDGHGAGNTCAPPGPAKTGGDPDDPVGRLTVEREFPDAIQVRVMDISGGLVVDDVDRNRTSGLSVCK